MGYQPIENYGIIGDLHTVALVGLNGSIDFMCFPEFNSPSIFAALLDDKKGGCFSISPVFSEMKNKQLYLPDTNVLLTRFLSTDGVGEILDFMPVVADHNEGQKLIRRITTVRGEVKYQLQCRPRFNYGRDVHTAEQTGPNEILFHCEQQKEASLRLSASIPMQISDQDAVVEFTLSASQSADFLLEEASAKPAGKEDSFIRLGYTKEAGYFMNWVEKLCQDIKGQERLGIMYSIDGQRQLKESCLDHFEGYKQSRPVRIGNDAYSQLQLDIYGELMDSVYLYNKYGAPISYDFWKNLEQQMDWLSDNWNQPDDGIWEVRGGQKNFLYSRLSCWVALDRAMKIAEARSFPHNGNWNSCNFPARSRSMHPLSLCRWSVSSARRTRAGSPP